MQRCVTDPRGPHPSCTEFRYIFDLCCQHVAGLRSSTILLNQANGGIFQQRRPFWNDAILESFWCTDFGRFLVCYSPDQILLENVIKAFLAIFLGYTLY